MIQDKNNLPLLRRREAAALEFHNRQDLIFHLYKDLLPAQLKVATKELRRLRLLKKSNRAIYPQAVLQFKRSFRELLELFVIPSEKRVYLYDLSWCVNEKISRLAGSFAFWHQRLFGDLQFIETGKKAGAPSHRNEIIKEYDEMIGSYYKANRLTNESFDIVRAVVKKLKNKYSPRTVERALKKADKPLRIYSRAEQRSRWASDKRYSRKITFTDKLD